MLKRLFAVCALLAALLVMQPSPALACSGYPYFGVDDLPTMEVLVKATVLESDDRGFNAVIRVEEYYKGEGPQLLTVMRYPVALSSGALVRGYDTGCLYSGRGHRWMEGTQGYFGLNPNGDGTFTDENWGTAHFYPIDGEIYYEEGATEGYAAEFDEPLVITEAAFIEKLLEAGEREAPLPPTVDAFRQYYPLKRFLTITTENGTRYQVNPDRSVMALPEDGPLAISPDGAHVAFRADDESVMLRYIWTTRPDEENIDQPDYHLHKPGEAVAFSNDSNMVAVWDDEQLSVYMFSNLAQSSEYGYGNGMELLTVAQVALESGDSLAEVRWSADSSTIVWRDASGIWRWNLVEDAEAAQVIAAEDIAEGAAILDVSTYGRYIQVGQRGEWILIDGITGEQFENGIPAPTEQFVIFPIVDPTVRIDESRCTPPLRETCPHYLGEPEIEAVFPYQHNLMGIMSCEGRRDECRIEGVSWYPSIGGTGSSGGRYISTTITDVRQITYDPYYKQPAIVVGDTRVMFDFYSDYAIEEYLQYLDLIDLEDEIDSPIVSVAWGQAVFFDEYLLTTSTHMPR